MHREGKIDIKYKRNVHEEERRMLRDRVDEKLQQESDTAWNQDLALSI